MRLAGSVGCLVAAAAIAAMPVPASVAAPPPIPTKGQDDPCKGHCHDILPPGTNGTATLPQLATFLTGGTRPPHSDDMLEAYDALVYGYDKNLSEQTLGNYYADSDFGVDPGDIARTYSPHPDAVIVRDKRWGIPHIYSSSRAGAMYSIGYAAAEDRLFLMDALRNVGRGRLAQFAGGAQGNRDFDAMQWGIAPYTEDDLQHQFDQYSDPRFAELYSRLYGESVQKATESIATLREDAVNYVAGINKRISDLRANPLLMPGEYAAIGRPSGPEDWNVRDIIATASLVGGIFGKGGGGEVDNAVLYSAFLKKFGKAKGTGIYRALRSAEDPDAPLTVFRDKGRFPYQVRPRKPVGNAMPDGGQVTPQKLVVEASGAGAADLKSLRSRASAAHAAAGLNVHPRRGRPGVLAGALNPGDFPGGMSNALLVSASKSQSGHPIAVMGPQTGYFAPQLLMLQEVVAPGIHARGAAFAGTNLYVQLGRGLDYSWSATSAGQDIIDTFAVDLCEPGGGTPTTGSMGYKLGDQCLPIERVRRTNSWKPTVADGTAAGTETLETQRTKLGLVTNRGTVGGRPVAFTALRPTYFHEVDSATGFAKFNDPGAIHGPEEWQRAANEIGYTFNWFYADSSHIAYFNSGYNTQRPPGPDPDFPVPGTPDHYWVGEDFDLRFAQLQPFETHPRAIDQTFLSSWNNKQAAGFRAADGQWGWSATHRVEMLNRRIRNGIRGDRKMNLLDLVWAMEDAGTVDLRGQDVLRYALAVIRRGGEVADPDLRDAVGKLEHWRRGGAHRRDADHNGVYDEADAVAIMDAWWPLWVKAQFEPVLGEDLYKAVIVNKIGIHDAPGHIGSSFQDHVYGHVRKDLRNVLGLKVNGAYPVKFCGSGKLAACREALLSTLKEAVAASKDRAKLYDGASCSQGDAQWCHDAVEQSPTGGITQRLIHWINRPTFQQAVEYQSHR